MRSNQVNPSAGRPLSPGAVDGFVLWTRNLRPLLSRLDEVRRIAPFVVQFTLTGYPRALESSVITRQEAIRLFTRGNSWFLRMEDKIGSIEPGKLADLAVLNKDCFAVPDAEIKQIRSVLTVVDGKIVHNAGVT